MDGLLVIKLKDATPLQIEEQFQMRVERIQSNDVFNLANQLMKDSVENPISIELLCKIYEKPAHNMCAAIRQLRTAHGLEIKNVAPFGTKGMYQLVGFCERDYRPYIKPKKKYKTKAKPKLKPTTYNPLINSVFLLRIPNERRHNRRN